MVKNNKRKYKKITCLLIVFTLLLSSSSFFNSFNNFLTNPELSTIQEEDISVEWGNNVYQNLPYWYSGTFYNDVDYTFAWTTAKIQFEYIPDSSITYEHSITELGNSETQYPTNSSFSMVNGTHVQNGTLDSVDDDYHAFDSTYDKVIVEQPNNFTIGAGNSTYDGNLEFLDGNYTTFESEKLPESEHYPATDTFTDDANGAVPNGWTDSSGVDCSATIISDLDGHKKVLELYDNSNQRANITQTFSSGQIKGTVEFWWRVSNIIKKSYIVLKNQAGDDAIHIYTMNSGVNYWDGAGHPILDPPLVNTWYHFRIDFDCTTDTMGFYLDGVLLYADGDFFHESDTLNAFSLYTNNAPLDYYIYGDAIGYSWNFSSDTGYEALGDNWYYDNYLGNQTFEQYNTTNYGELTELEDNGWTFNLGAGTSARIIGEDSSHKKILDLFDNGNPGIASASYSTADEMYGTAEYWLKATDAARGNVLYLKEGGTILLGFMIKTDKFQYWNGAWNDVGLGALDNTWYHIRIDFECTAGGYQGLAQYDWHVYIDDVHYGDYDFDNNQPHVDEFYLETAAVATNYHYCIDSLSFSWDSGYTIGDNQRTGDLLDLEIEVNVNLSSFSNLNELYLVYAYLTDISLTCNFLIYNFDSSSFDIIENDINLAFVNSYFLLNSSYYNATNDIILSFGMAHPNTEFEMRLDRLLVRKPSYLNFSTTVNFDVIINLLQMNIESYQRSNISQLINMSIWNYDTSSWVNLNGSSYISTFQLLEWINSTFSNYINSNGDVSLSYYGVNITDVFRFELDALNFTLWRKTIIQYEKTLSLLGTWKYRFILDAGLGTQHIVDWVYFNVIEQQANFEGISESRYSTQWVLTSTATTGEKNIVYEDQLTSGYWGLTDTASYNFWGDYNIDQDSWVNNRHTPDYRDTNYGSETTLQSYVGVYDPGYWQWYRKVYMSFNTIDEDYFDLNMTWNPNNLLYLYAYQVEKDWSAPWIYLYSTTAFDEDTITWNNKPAIVDLIDSHDTIAGNMYFDLGSTSLEGRYLELHQAESAGWAYAYFYSREYSSLNPQVYVSYVKNYHDTTGEGYAYFQTDTTENLGLISPQYSSKSLEKGDIFTVDLETTSDNALLKLYNGGVLQQTLNLLIGNTKTTQQTVEVLVSEDVSFDQVKITSELTDTEYFKLYDIKAEHWIFEDEEDQRSMYVNPYGQNDLIANLGNNSLKIYENDILRTDIYITISYDLLTHIFESTIPETIFVSFYDSNNDYLDFNKFTTYINYTLYEENYINQRLTSREFYVDEESTIYFNVYDSFEVSIYSALRLAKTFIDIILNIHFLKIKNEALDDASYTLTKGNVSKSGILFPEDIDEYQIASGNYSFNYINYEDNSEHSLNINLVENQLLTINTTYFDIYFSLFNYDGLGLERDLFRFYINGLRKDFGFNTLKQDTNSLKILDYFNATLFNQDIALKQYTEYNLFVEVYALIINNNYSHSIKIEIERGDIDITFEQVISAQFGMPYRFLPNIEYYIKSYHLNGTLLEEKTVLLDEQFEIISFGFYSTEVPTDPNPFFLDFVNFSIFLMVISAFGLFGLFLYFRMRYHQKRLNPRLKRRKRKIGAGTYDDRGGLD